MKIWQLWKKYVKIKFNSDDGLLTSKENAATL